jgi:hypothetical protein
MSKVSKRALNYSYERCEFDAYLCFNGKDYQSSADGSSPLNEAVKDFIEACPKKNVILLHNFDVQSKTFCTLVNDLISVQPASFKVIISTTCPLSFLQPVSCVMS